LIKPENLDTKVTIIYTDDTKEKITYSQLAIKLKELRDYENQK